jgi:hypothetical protein
MSWQTANCLGVRPECYTQFVCRKHSENSLPGELHSWPLEIVTHKQSLFNMYHSFKGITAVTLRTTPASWQAVSAAAPAAALH